MFNFDECFFLLNAFFLVMVGRVESYIRNGWDHMIVDPDNCLSRDPKCDDVEQGIGPEVVS